MAYKLVCQTCKNPVKVKFLANTWLIKCGCFAKEIGSLSPNWKTQESGVIPVSNRQKYCTGCEDNFYNGNNTVGVKVCWNLDDAKVVKKKKIGIDDEPPWEHQPVVTTLSCFHQKGYVFLTDCTRRY